jgi:predicted nucleotidyltransferase
MTLPEEIREYLKYIAASISAAMPVSAIYLFGSYAQGEYRVNRSDLDLYIVSTDKSKQWYELTRVARKSFTRKMRIPIDLIVNHDDIFQEQSQKPYTLEHEVITNGININDFK